MQLFKTTAEIKKYLRINVNMKFENLQPDVQDAESIFIRELLGDLYQSFLEDYTNNTDASGTDTGMSADNKALLPYVQRALAFYTMYLAVDHIGAQVGDAGIQQTSSQNAQPAPLWKVRDLQASYIDRADRFAEQLLEYLEENATALKYGAWFADIVANTKMSGVIVNSTRVASKHIDINDSRRFYLKLKRRIKEIETTFVKRLICSDQYDELVTQLQTGTVTATNQKLIDKLEPYISRKALFDQMPFLRVLISGSGISIRSSSDGVVSRAAVTDNTAVGNIPYKTMVDSLYERVVDDEEALKKFINDSIADYPLIAASPCYSTEPLPDKYVADNDPCNKHFSV